MKHPQHPFKPWLLTEHVHEDTPVSDLVRATEQLDAAGLDSARRPRPVLGDTATCLNHAQSVFPGVGFSCHER